MLRVGLTGGIGCGKSIVAQHFAALNIPFIDADSVAHHLTAAGSPVLDTIEAIFGEDARLPGGELNRAWLRGKIFSDPHERKKLEAVLHPLIFDVINKQLQALHDVPYVLLVIPLLLETQQYQNLVDRVLIVDCDVHLQRARVHERSGLSHAEVDAIIAVQMPRTKRLALADDVITNTADLAALQAQVQALHLFYLGLASKML